MNRKSTLIVFALIIFISLNLSAKKKEEYKKWIKEVGLVITDVEKAEFKKLKKEKDKEFFIKLFWAKRDPTPQTEMNEFKEEYYRRLSYIKKSFRYGYKTGIKTDMGKVYLYFGKPARVFRQDPRYEIWVYPVQPWMNLPKETFSFVFTVVEIERVHKEEERTRELTASTDMDGYFLDLSKTDSKVMTAHYSYPNAVLLYPDLKELPEYKKIITFSPESFEGKLIQKLKSAQEDIVQIPFEKKTIFTKAKNKSSYLTILLKIDPAEKKDIIEKKLNFFGRIESESYFYNFSEEKVPIKEKGYFISQVGLPLRPGKYKLFLGFYSPDKKTYSIKVDNIEVPDFWKQELAISSLLVSSQVQEVTAAAKKEEFDVFSLGRYSLLPLYGQDYTKEESLNIFYYIYNLAVDENQNCSFLIELEFQLGEKKFKLDPQKRQKMMREESTLLEGTQIPLSALPESGEYELIVSVTDEVAKKTVSEKLKFLLLE